MRIHRSHPDENFTILPNEALRDQRLSYTARGILTELLSHSDGWETNADALWKLAQKNRGGKTGEGRRAIRAAFAELEEHGYLVRKKVQRDKGRFVTELDLFDDPNHRDTGSGTSVWDFDLGESADHHGDRGTARETSVDETSVGETSVSGTSLRSTNGRSTNREVREEEDSSALAGARAAALAARRKSQLNHLYSAVDTLPNEQLRNALLDLERRRPLIYRECRNHSIAQFEEKDRRILKSSSGGRAMDRLSYKYALLHYHDTADKWPTWLIRPLTAPGQGRAA